MAKRKVKQVTRVAPLLLVVVAIFGIDGDRAKSASVNKAAKRYCDPQPVGNVVRPLNGMPGRKPVPKYTSLPDPDARQLPFGPRMLRVSEIGTLVGDRILTGKGEYGFDFYLDTTNARLGWQVSLTGFAVDGQGHTMRKLGVSRRTIGRIGGLAQPQVTLAIPGKEGFYRVDLLIRNRKGKVLGQFREYLRVLEPAMSVRLSTDASVVLPSSHVAARIENVGTIPVLFGAGYSVEYYNGATWTRVGPSQKAWRRYLGFLGAGAAGHCMHFTLPVDAALGQYRFVKRIYEDEDQKLEQILYREFSVVAP